MFHDSPNHVSPRKSTQRNESLGEPYSNIHRYPTHSKLETQTSQDLEKSHWPQYLSAQSIICTCKTQRASVLLSIHNSSHYRSDDFDPRPPPTSRSC